MSGLPHIRKSLSASRRSRSSQELTFSQTKKGGSKTAQPCFGCAFLSRFAPPPADQAQADETGEQQRQSGRDGNYICFLDGHCERWRPGGCKVEEVRICALFGIKANPANIRYLTRLRKHPKRNQVVGIFIQTRDQAGFEKARGQAERDEGWIGIELGREWWSGIRNLFCKGLIPVSL